MKLSCLFGRHKALPSDVRNLKLRVSQCRGCGCDMIHRRGRWTTVPRGFRIVWRRLDEVMAEAVPLKLVRNLPVPSRRTGFSFGDLVRRGLEAIDLAGPGLGMVGWAVGDFCRGLIDSLRTPPQPQQLVLPLFPPRPAIATRFGIFTIKSLHLPA